MCHLAVAIDCRLSAWVVKVMNTTPSLSEQVLRRPVFSLEPGSRLFNSDPCRALLTLPLYTAPSSTWHCSLPNCTLLPPLFRLCTAPFHCTLHTAPYPTQTIHCCVPHNAMFPLQLYTTFSLTVHCSLPHCALLPPSLYTIPSSLYTASTPLCTAPSHTSLYYTMHRS